MRAWGSNEELNMLYNKELSFPVPFPLTNMKEGGTICTSEIVSCLLKHLKAIRTLEQYGYILAITELISIGRELRDSAWSSHIFLHVRFRCRTFIPEQGDVMIGTVFRVSRTGVFLKCGPVVAVYLPMRKMGGYSYVEGEKTFFLSSDQSRIELNSAIRYTVFAVKWGVLVGKTRQFMILATIEVSSLGPIQSAGSDAEDFEMLCAD